jgi:hypothetical protein
VDLIPDVLPVIGWTDDIGYTLLALVCGYIGWNLRRRRLTGEPPSRQATLPFFKETMQLWHGMARHAGEAEPLDESRARDRSLAHMLRDG